MDRASDHAGASDHRLGAKNGLEVFEGGRCGEFQQRRAARVQEAETDVGKSCDADQVRRQARCTFILEDNPVDFIIRDQEGLRSRIVEYELQMQQVGELVGNPPRENLIAAIQEAI